MKKSNSYIINSKTIFLFVLSSILFFSSCKTSKTTSATGFQKPLKTGELTDKQQTDFDYLFYNANKEKILGNYDLAETFFSQALKINPNNSATLYELANIYGFQKNKTKALEYSKKAATLDTKNVWYQILYAECLKENKQPAEVAKVYEQLVKNNPDKIDFYYELANAYLYMNKAPDALKIYDKVESRFGITEEIAMQKIKIFKATKNTDKAIEEIKKLIIAFPKEAKYYGILGELYQDKNDPDNAFQAYNDLLKIDPTNAYVHLSLADYYRNQKQNDKAFEEIKTAFKSKELDIDTKVKILLSYYSITETYSSLKSDADELCKIIVDVHPDEAKAFTIYGDFLYRDKKMEEARAQYKKAIVLEKEKFAIWNQLLFIDSELKDFDAMQKDSKEAMELFPNQALPYFFNGSANLQLKNYKDALESFLEGKEFVIENDMLLSQFYANIGDTQNSLKNYTSSDSAYDKALELDTKNLYVMNNYAYYLSLRKFNLEKAEKMSKKSNELDPNNNSYQDTYGWILYQMKKYDDAKTWVQKAIDNGGKENGTLLEHFADILYKLGETDKALGYWINAKKAGGTTDLIDKKIADKKLYE